MEGCTIELDKSAGVFAIVEATIKLLSIKMDFKIEYEDPEDILLDNPCPL